MENQTNATQEQQNIMPASLPNAYSKPHSFADKNKLLIKGMIVAMLILFLMIPQLFIHNLVSERKNRLIDVENQIANTWSDSQTIAGPMIVIPYRKLVNSTNGTNPKTYYTKAYAYIMPEKLNINTMLSPNSKRVSIFNVSVYESSIGIKGSFKNINWAKLNIASENVYWSEAKVLIGINDYKGLMNQAVINWNGKEIIGEPGFDDKTILQKAIQFPIILALADFSIEHTFSCELKLRGTSSINFIPVGNQTNVTLDTKWSTPRFAGNYPANYNADFATKPLHATWNVLSINRNFPQQWSDESFNLNNDSFGLSLIQPIDTYAKTMRSVKYAILLIALTFIIYFFIELMQKKLAHPIQYVLVGLALTIFYLLLLSIAEYAGFNWAYCISAIGTIGLISLYTGSVFAQQKITYAIAGFLSLLYIFIYLLIQLEDGALLLGSIGLFVILGAIMYGSKKINWYPLPNVA